MEYLVQFFAWLMEWCHSWCPNYWADIVIFTFFTKILQFPVALWCQANSLKMVALMPESNRIKMEHYGDKDAIGDETAALFKRAHYHPLLALVPLAIQIVILLAFVKVIYGIGDRLTVPGAAKPLIACVPWNDGGWAWLMPLFAGAAAWLLGYTQNIYNPLQHEQSRREQLVTNGISICISLFLGCFVAVGVGLYWATSNVFAIVVQYFENLTIPPKKHVDYPALRQSQAELKKFEDSLASAKFVSKEDRRREKADYKRFFKVANKHLVFYAEGGGYYKYFQAVIEWLLEHSNVTIHYVTNDPKDGIFARAKENKQIRAYYIGQVKIIPLMMKMDAEMVVMTTPDLNTYQIKRSYVKKDVEYAFIEHGPTSIHMCYRKGALDHFDTIFSTGRHHQAEHLATERVYGLKPKKIIEAGYPYFDTLFAQYAAAPKSVSPRKRILIAPSYQKGNVVESHLDALIPALMGPDRLVVVRPHPQQIRRMPAKMQALVEKWKGQIGDGLQFEMDFSSNSSVYESDVLVTDWSGIAYEFSFTTKKPCIFVDTPMKVINPEYEKIGLVPTEITFRSEVGQIVKPEEIAAQVPGIVTDMLARPTAYAEKIEKLMNSTFFNLGHAAPVIGKYILDSLIAKKKKGNAS